MVIFHINWWFQPILGWLFSDIWDDYLVINIYFLFPNIGMIVIGLTSQKYEFVNWDDDIPNIMGKWQMFQTTNQMTILGFP